MRRYKSKNPLCIGSKLSESAFLAVLKLFCFGRPASYCVRVISRWGRKGNVIPIKRITVERYFHAMGRRAMEDWYQATTWPDLEAIPLPTSAANKSVHDSSPNLIEQIWKSGLAEGVFRILQKSYDYKSERSSPLKKFRFTTIDSDFHNQSIPYLENTPFVKEFLPPLRALLLSTRGFHASTNTFDTYLGYASLIFHAKGGTLFMGKLPRRRVLRKIQKRAFLYFKQSLDEKPLILTQGKKTYELSSYQHMIDNDEINPWIECFLQCQAAYQLVSLSRHEPDRRKAEMKSRGRKDIKIVKLDELILDVLRRAKSVVSFSELDASIHWSIDRLRSELADLTNSGRVIRCRNGYRLPHSI